LLAEPATFLTTAAMAACADILSHYQDEWKGAVTHRFLTAVQDGTIQAQQFDAWLVQDGLFAREFTRFQAHALAKAPVAHFDLLLSGMGALQDELRWFADLTRKRGLSLEVAPSNTCSKYITFMANCAKQPYACHAVALWAIEKAYHDAWHTHMPGMPAPYHHYAERWGSLAFGDYVDALQRQADEALAAASAAERQEAEALFVQVCGLEREFWSMAFGSATEQA
jgi:thiaminase/transcriptional activator TenA